MKAVLISDTHLKIRGNLVRGVDPASRLEQCVSTIRRIADDADICILLGDLADTPTVAEYETLLEILQPLNIPVHFIVGNHDDRNIFRLACPWLPSDENGFVQSSYETRNERLLFLDTLSEGQHEGDYSTLKLEWLERQLFETSLKATYLFMHHPPFKSGFWNDYSMIQQAEPLLDLVVRSRRVSHIFAGHTHRAASGNWRGITWSTLHGICYENDFEMLPAKPNYRSGPAQIGILLLNGDESVLHFQDALDQFPLIAYSGKSLREPDIAAE
ncbi:phosphodiesterase [Sinorhizobium meliloti]|uniref:phosphodiesterase n=1 Tax=Rhizobium meliloti TaxID=382 RepID=UPI00067E69FD|nr:phosphodiesterase [Sinorhizobium meliloti]MDE3823625.1 phosphodiesterase [Sinorhizobium meliloti]RVH13509.1 phosphodiesterase [Sinorhizobium meliloti]RVI02047.1 phosphodiesterase [Sinorhizobium meliloti]RVM43218.1 phosphodiesterase [Sinorhizobium meliloti]RVN63059.1 phosphodiesterase [Sinorhizobium meliloti]